MTDIIFADAEDAIRWSLECCNIPDLGSQLSMWQKSGGARLTREEVRDIAQTISVIVSSFQPWMGDALMAVYSGHDDERDIYLGEEIGRQLACTESGEDKPFQRLAGLGRAVVKSQRAKRLYGRRYWYRRMANDIGIHVDTLRKKQEWLKLMAAALEILNDWIDRGLRLVTTELKELGWLT